MHAGSISIRFLEEQIRNLFIYRPGDRWYLFMSQVRKIACLFLIQKSVRNSNMAFLKHSARTVLPKIGRFCGNHAILCILRSVTL